MSGRAMARRTDLTDLLETLHGGRKTRQTTRWPCWSSCALSGREWKVDAGKAYESLPLPASMSSEPRVTVTVTCRDATRITGCSATLTRSEQECARSLKQRRSRLNRLHLLPAASPSQSAWPVSLPRPASDSLLTTAHTAIYTVYTSPNHPPIPNHLPTLIVTPHGMVHTSPSSPNFNTSPQDNRPISSTRTCTRTMYAVFHARLEQVSPRPIECRELPLDTLATG